MPFKIVLFLLASCFASAQAHGDNQSELTQLQTELAQTPTPGNQRLELLVKLVRKCWRSCPDEAIEYAVEAQRLLLDLPNPLLEARMMGFLVRIYIGRGDYETAQKLTEQGIKAGRLSGNETELSRVLFNQAVIYSNHEKLILAESIYQELLQIYTRLGNDNGIASTLNNLGFMSHKLSDYGAALEYYQKALPIYESLGNKANYANTLVNIADVHMVMDDLEQAKTSAQLALNHLANIKAPRVTIYAYQTLSMVLWQSNDPQGAINGLSQAKEIAQANKFTPTLIVINTLLSEIYTKQGNLDQAISHNNAALALLNDSLPEKYTHMVRTETARIAMYEKHWQLAQEILEPILKDKDPARFLDRNSNPFRLMVQLQEKQGNWKEAAKLNRIYLELYAEYAKTNRKSRAEQFAALYQKSQKERQIAQLEQQNSAQQLATLQERESKRLTLFISAIVMMILFLFIFLGMQRRKVIKMEAAMIKENLEKSKRMFSDISHELRTPLTIIKLKIEELEHQLDDDPQAAYKVMHEKLAGFNLLIDDISLLARADAGDLELNRTAVNLPHFFTDCVSELTALAGEHGLTVVHNIRLNENDTCLMDEMRMHQIMTNLFTNSCRYTDSPGTIEMAADIHSNQLIVTVSDSAPGLSEDEIGKMFDRLYRADQSRNSARGGSGLGLAICKRLVLLHQGQMTAQHSDKGGICIMLSIPLKTIA